MNIPPELQDRLIEVLRTAHDNAVEIHLEAKERYRGYKQTRINLLNADVDEAAAVLDAVLALKGEQK
jgi:hypothetical protein